MERNPAGGPRTLLHARLSVAMFLHYFVMGAWVVPAGSYLNSVLGFSGSQIGWIFAMLAVGAMVSSLLAGYLADRFFSTERVLCSVHLAGSICLLGAAQQTRFPGMITAVALHALCFMPSLPLSNSLCFRNIPDANRYSQIAVWGTVGWMLSGLWVGFLLGEGDPRFFYLASLSEIVLAFYCLTLPHTPPRKSTAAEANSSGPLVRQLWAGHAVRVFIASVLLTTMASGFYLTWANAFLEEIRAPRPTALMTLSQLSEIVVMLVMPLAIGRFGLKWILTLGMGAWVLRCVCFATMALPLVIAGLLLHGFCYCFVLVAAYTYVDRIAPPGTSARAQGLLTFLSYGVGNFFGSRLAGFIADQYPATWSASIRHDWPWIWGWAGCLALAACLLFFIGGREPVAAAAGPGPSPAAA